MGASVVEGRLKKVEPEGERACQKVLYPIWRQPRVMRSAHNFPTIQKLVKVSFEAYLGCALVTSLWAKWSKTASALPRN